MNIDVIDVNYEDEKLKSIVKNIVSEYPDRAGVRAFIRAFSAYTLDNLEWANICDICRISNVSSVLVYHFMVEVLTKKMYNNTHSEALYRLLPLFEYEYSNRIYPSKLSHKIFCYEKVDNLLYFNYHESKRIVYSKDFISPFMFSVFDKMLHCDSLCFKYITEETFDSFLDSLESSVSSITKLEDFNGELFWKQIAFLRKKYPDMRENTVVYNRYLLIVHFYRDLIEVFPDTNFFENDLNMTPSLIFNRMLLSYIERDFQVLPYTTTVNLKGINKVLFITRNINKTTTQFKGESCFAFDISSMSCEVYQDLLKEYFISSINITNLRIMSGFLRETLEKIYIAKTTDGYPNPDLLYLSNEEAVFIKEIIKKEFSFVRTINNNIGHIRRFLLWLKNNNKIHTDDMFFSYLKQYEEPTVGTAKAMSDENLVKLNNYIVNDMKMNHNAKIMYAIFHIAIQTPFRISQICHLKTDCIKPSLKEHMYYIESDVSKTSRGTPVQYTITELTYKIIMNVLEDTEKLRENILLKDEKDYLFLIETEYKGTSLIGGAYVNDYLAKACKALKIEKITAGNLRDTHMTKALEYAMRHGKTDLELSVLSMHKNVDTTKNHYIDIELNKMLEATYGITIGDFSHDINNHIVESLPVEVENNEHEVENGCGHCDADNCINTSNLPCLVCKHFKTTIKHKSFFEKQIETQDLIISKTSNRHSIEDLNTIKTLYALYLKSIIKKMEE